MIDALRREAVYLWYYMDILLRQIMPYWALGVVLGSAVSVFGKRYIHGAFARIGARRMGWLGVFPASLLGIASPLCMYGTVPIAASFSEQGVRDEYLASFMVSSALLNPQLIVYSGALGRTALIIRVASCFLCGALAGLLVRALCKGRPFFSFEGFRQRDDRDVDPSLPLRFLKNIGRNVRATAPWLAVGLIVTVLYQRYAPADAVARLFGANEGFGVLMAATLGVPLYMCGGGTIPLLMDWLATGMSMGSAAAFMLTGPGTKLTNLGALKTVLGAKHFLYYILYIVGFALATGLLVDWIA